MRASLTVAAMTRAFCALIVAGAAAPAIASDDAYWEYGDWTVTVATSFGEEHAYTECRAATGGDGEPVLSVVAGLIDGEVREPPMVEVVEYAMRGMATALVDGSTTAFLFDDGTMIPAAVHTHDGEDGPMYRVGRAVPTDGLVRPMLWAMRHSDSVQVAMSPDWTQAFSLRGFTASLGKLAEHCGVDMRGLID